MIKHVCEWELYTAGLTGKRVIACCVDKECDVILQKDEIEAMLNAHAELLEALEKIAAMAPCENHQGWGKLCGEYDTCSDMHGIACQAIRKAKGE